MFQKSVLENGVRVLTWPLPQAYSVSVAVVLGAGSRYEPEGAAGAFHFIEHLCFKGTRRRPTPREVGETLERVGGVVNAFTDREVTVFWAKVPHPHFSLALDLLVDLLREPLFQPEEVEKERQVIVEELATSNDYPDYRVDLLLDEALWPGHPLGRDVGGDPHSIQALDRDALLSFKERQYTPANMVLSVAGRVSHQEVVREASRLLAGWAPAEPLPWAPVRDGLLPSPVRLEHRQTDQTHLCLGLRALPASHPDRYALDLLSIVLGEGMTSRLFLELREHLGLVYEVHSSLDYFRDCGALTVYSVVEPSKAPRAVSAILGEMEHLRDQVPEEELRKAKEVAKGRLLLRLEDTRQVALWAGVQEALLGRVLTAEQVMERVEAVTTEDLRRVAQALLDRQGMRLAVVGPHRTDSPFLPLLAR